uniref:ubiquitin-like domain-containing protein n=1 Tax=Bacillus pumilus TaxID=1408 RepID=UPI003703B5D7
DQTVPALFNNDKIHIPNHHQLTPGNNHNIQKDIHLLIHQPFHLNLNHPRKHNKLSTTSTTVTHFLNQQDLKLNKHDKSKPPL